MKSRGKKSPLDEIPKLDENYSWYSKAYSMLRSSANQNGIIPLSEILAYTEYFGLVASVEEFVLIIRGLEEKEAEYHENKNKSEEKKPKKTKR